MPARDCVKQPFEGFPAYGAVHGVVPSRQLQTFLNAFNDEAFDTFDDTERTVQVVRDDEGQPNEIESSEFDPRGYFRLFGYHTLGVSVLEMDPSANTARKVQKLWEKNDFGATEKEAKNELAKHIPDQKLHVVFDRAIPVGGKIPGTTKDVRQKIALLPSVERSAEVYEIVNKEADICIDSIARRLKQFIYPWDITPHMTFAVYKSKAAPQKIERMLRWANKSLKDTPVGTALDPLTFRFKSERGHRKH